MAYIVTARKWRPTRFEDVVGQEHITTTIKNAIKNDRIAHAYLFAGPRGVGKTTTARILAKTLNCLNPVDFEPCNECDMCKSFNTSQSLDIIEIDGASNRRIEEIRSLRESVKYAPTKGTYKVYIIDEVHMLTNESFNALLKTLEEPPEHTIFIFATTDVHKVPLTIISRCQRFDFRRIELDSIKALLNKIATSEEIKIDDQSLTLIAKKADGALRDAESLFDQIASFSNGNIEATTVGSMLNLIDDDIYFQISEAVLDKTFISAFNITKRIYDNGWNFIDFFNGLTEHFRNIMTVRLTGTHKMIEAAEIYRAKYLGYKDKYSESDLLRILYFLNKVQIELKQTSNQRLKVEVALCHLIGLEKSASIREVIDNLEEIKKKTPDLNFQSQQEKYSSIEPKIQETQLPTSKESHNYVELPPDERTDQPEEILDELKNIKAKWDIFLTEINSEKFIAGGALKSARLVSIDGNKLYLSTDDLHSKNTIIQNKDYFTAKTTFFFGKAYYFYFKDSSGIAETSYYDPENDSTAIIIEKSVETNPVVKAIIEELDGEEIS
ncbi:MAG: DNA polymerase III subunit gamma/tau [Ignavibacteria bacterium]